MVNGRLRQSCEPRRTTDRCTHRQKQKQRENGFLRLMKAHHTEVAAPEENNQRKADHVEGNQQIQDDPNDMLGRTPFRGRTVRARDIRPPRARAQKPTSGICDG